MSLANIWFRTLQNSDRDDLFDLHNAIIGKESYRQFQRAIDKAEGVWVLAVDDLLVGYTAVFRVPALDGLLEMQGGIVPAYRRRGLGSVLLRGVIEALRPSSFHTLSYPVVDMDTAVAHFLQYHDFEVEHEEWLMTCTDLTNLPPIPENSCHIQTLPRRRAITQFLEEMYEASFAGMAWDQPFSPAEVAATLHDEDEILFLTEADRYIGFAWLRFPEPHLAEIEPIGIVQTEQGQGYGRVLLTTILHKLVQQNIQTVTLGVWAANHKAIALYQSVGFVHTDTVTYLAHSIDNR